MVSAMVVITVLEMITDRGSPWYTPTSMGNGSVDHSLVQTIPTRHVSLNM